MDERLAAFLPYINATQPFVDNDPIKDVHECRSLLDRWRLYRKWVRDAKAYLVKRMENAPQEYAKAVRELGDLRSLGDTSILKAAKVRDAQ